MTPTAFGSECRARIRFKPTCSNKEDELAHYGIKGQKWGVITKEYEPVAIDHRRTGRSPRVGMINRIKQNYAVRSAKNREKRIEGRKSFEQEVKANREKWKKIKYGAFAAAAILAAYAGYRYVKVTKAKAYTGLLNRFLNQNPGAGYDTHAARELLRSGVNKAKANSNTFKNAFKTNRYLKSHGLAIKGKPAMRVYKARNLLDKSANIHVNTGNIAKDLVNKYRQYRIRGKIYNKLYR